MEINNKLETTINERVNSVTNIIFYDITFPDFENVLKVLKCWKLPLNAIDSKTKTCYQLILSLQINLGTLIGFF